MGPAIVIGGGISGMAAALLLRRRGLEVTLIERHPRLAPLLRGFSRGGLTFDTGFHYGGALEKDELVWKFLDYLGVADRITTLPYNPECFDVVKGAEEGLRFEYPYGYDRLSETFARVFPRERNNIVQYFRTIQKIYSEIPQKVLMPRMKGQKVFGGIDWGLSLEDYLGAHFTDAQLIKLLCTHCLLYGMRPGEAPFIFHAQVMGTYYQSVSAIRGGGLKIAQVMEQLLEESHVNILRGKAVTDLQTDAHNRVTHARLSDESCVNGETWIFSANAKLLSDLIAPENQPPRLQKRLKSYDETSSAIVLYGILQKDQSPFEHPLPNTICMSMSSDDLTSFGENHSFFAPGDTGNGRQTAATYIVPERWKTYQMWKNTAFGGRPSDYYEAKTARMEALALRFASENPELADKVKWIEGATPLTLCHYTGNPAGGLYGLKHRTNDFLLMPDTRIPNLYLTGQNIVAPGLAGGFMSAFMTVANLFNTSEFVEEIHL